MGYINLRPEAERDLVGIYKYIAKKVDRLRARAFVTKIEQRIIALSNQPRSGRTRNELKQGMWSVSIENYLIFYFPLSNGVDVLRVIYGGRDLDSIFNENDKN